jgi:hypothetical protein
MGRTYAYELIARRSSADRLVQALTEHLVPDQRKYLLKTLKRGAEGVMDRFQRAMGPEWELGLARPLDACLTFLFPVDEHTTEFVADYPERLAPTADGRLPIGCVWTDVECGDAFVRVRATAATSSMSAVFARSPGVRATFAASGRAGDALLVAYDDESNVDLDAVWPHEGRFAFAYEPPEWSAPFSVDHYAADLLDVLGQTFGGPPLDSGI